MSELSSQVIANWVLNYNFLGSCRLQEVIFKALKQNISKWSDEKLYEEVEKHEKYVFQLLGEKYNEFESEGINPPFKIEEDGGSCFYAGFPIKENPILDKIISEDSKKFEVLCKNILERLGASSEVTGGTDDGGVDFIGYGLPVGAIKFETRIANRLLVIGQAKKCQRGKTISEKQLRAFVGAAIKRRYDLLVEKKYDTKYIQPTVYAFWTTSDFHPDAQIYAKTVGLWALNGICVARLMIELGIVKA
jgi:hypothetical protein